MMKPSPKLNIIIKQQRVYIIIYQETLILKRYTNPSLVYSQIMFINDLH